jgi:polyketide cyclase/dehydrase/lipid transport protein
MTGRRRRWTRRSSHALALLVSLAAPLPATSIAASPTPDEERRLAGGEVLVELVPPPGGSPAEGVGRGAIDAPPERVFAALADFAHYEEWVPFVERSDAAPQPDGSVVSAQSLHLPALPALIGERHYRIRAVATLPTPALRVWSVRWTYVPGSGNVVDTRGSWTVVPFGPGRSLATCRLFTDPGGVPRWATNRATEKTLGWIFKGLRQQVLRDRYLHPASPLAREGF